VLATSSRRCCAAAAPIVALALAFFSPFSSAARDAATEVQDLYRLCLSPSWEFEDATCKAFVSGIAEQMTFNGRTATLPRKSGGPADGRDREWLSTLSACIPTDTSPATMVEAFIDWAEKHPERWTAPRQTGVMQALNQTWPCRSPTHARRPSRFHQD
jgi:hypothetical protein